MAIEPHPLFALQHHYSNEQTIMEQSRIQLLKKGVPPEVIDVLNNQNEAVIGIRVLLPLLTMVFLDPSEEESDDNYLPTSIENFEVILQSIGEYVEYLELDNCPGPTSVLGWEGYGRLCETVHIHLKDLNTICLCSHELNHEALMYFLFHLPRGISRIALCSIEQKDHRFIRMIPRCFPLVHKLVISGVHTPETAEDDYKLEVILATLIEGLHFLEELSILASGGAMYLGVLFEAIHNNGNIKELTIQGLALDEDSSDHLVEMIESLHGIRSIGFDDIRVAGGNAGLEATIKAMGSHPSLTHLRFAGLKTTDGEIITFDRDVENKLLYNLIKNKVKARFGKNDTLGVWVETVTASRNDVGILGFLFSDSDICPTVIAKAALKLDGPYYKERIQEEKLEGLKRDYVFQYRASKRNGGNDLGM